MPIYSPNFEYIRELICNRSGNAFNMDKEYLIESRLDSIARQEGFASVHEMITKLRTQPWNNQLHPKVVEAMLTTETSFFRDIPFFEALRKSVLPNLLEKRSTEKKLNLWCAACSSGQEPYSIAILLREHFPALASWTLTLIASDLSTEMLARAQEGRYSQFEVSRGLPTALLIKYYHQQGATWQIKEEIRRMVEFRQINLIAAWSSLPNMDIIFMRNVLIYFDTKTRKAILGKVRRSLKLDGYLFLGSAETTTNLDDIFENIQIDKTMVYRLRNE
jgi:chemotaxis protein methyltransferase CheR